MLKILPLPSALHRNLFSYMKLGHKCLVLHNSGGSFDSRNDALDFSDARLLMPEDPRFASVELIRRDEESSPLRIPLVWFRDHCRSVRDCTELFKKAKLAEDCYPINFDASSQQLHLFWADGHESCFSISDLLDWALLNKHKNKSESVDRWEASECPSRTLWNAESLKEIPTVSSKNFDFVVFARLFIRFGVVCVSDVDALDEQATQDLCQSIAPIHSTFFGDFWKFGTGQQQSMASFDDTAYGNEWIGPHTDGTYFDQPPGIQVFHCLKPANHGGDTLLVDGFAVANWLKTENPKQYRILTETTIEHHYLDGAEDEHQQPTNVEDEDQQQSDKGEEEFRLYSRSFRDPVIRLFPQTEKISQIRFNPYDRAPMRTLRMDEDEEKQGQMALEQTVLFYEAYERFAQLVNEQRWQLRIRLKPGMVLFLDNFRVLHARQAFQGDRVVCGCYLNRDCFLARARPLLAPNYYRNI